MHQMEWSTPGQSNLSLFYKVREGLQVDSHNILIHFTSKGWIQQSVGFADETL